MLTGRCKKVFTVRVKKVLTEGCKNLLTAAWKNSLPCGGKIILPRTFRSWFPPIKFENYELRFKSTGSWLPDIIWANNNRHHIEPPCKNDLPDSLPPRQGNKKAPAELPAKASMGLRLFSFNGRNTSKHIKCSMAECLCQCQKTTKKSLPILIIPRLQHMDR